MVYVPSMRLEQTHSTNVLLKQHQLVEQMEAAVVAHLADSTVHQLSALQHLVQEERSIFRAIAMVLELVSLEAAQVVHHMCVQEHLA